MNMLRKDIYVHPSADLLGRDLLNALHRLVPVNFKDCSNLAACVQGHDVLSLSGEDRVLGEMSKSGLRCFHVANRVAEPRSENAGEPVRFGVSECLDKFLRGRRVQHQAVPNLSGVRTEPGDEVLAVYGEKPVWVLRRSGGSAVQIVSAGLPQLTGSEKPFDYLNGYHFIQLLPLLHFLREVTSELGWTRPPLRACFTFDDSNLHWLSYGFLSYPELIQQARKDRFHVTFATVPLDGWGLHSRTVRLFKENPEQLSLMIHGNNHTRDELGQARTLDGHLQLMAQSLCRIERLERATGLHVNRVMVPPFEALSVGAMVAMLALGFEGASLSPWSLRYWNPERAWPAGFGIEIAEMTDGGFPVLARYQLSDACEGPAVISAFLGLPIVLVEHHKAVARGIELLSHAASVINSLGDVRWCSTETMLRSNYLSRWEGTTLWMKPYSCRVELQVPHGISSVVVAPMGDTDDGGLADFALICNRRDGEDGKVWIRSGAPISVLEGDGIRLISTKLGTIDYRQLKKPKSSVWPLSRRLLCEVRDRLVALMPGPRKA